MTEKMARRRVKFYALNAERQWDDRGTGHVTSSFVDRVKGVSLVVRAESDGSLLLESKILPDTAYQKQQGTLIVWSEGENLDLALSFQERVGCDEIWEKICQVQGKDPSMDITQDIVEESEDERFEESAENNLWVDLPPCELGKLEDINEIIGNCLGSALKREKLAYALESEGYIKKLISLFHMCEDVENIEGLHLLFEIFKHIFHLNKNTIFELMFSEDMIFDVVGALEYDPASSYPKRHRQYLKSIAKFKEVIPIENLELLNKIHQTYRVQYIQDVVLPTPQVFEENILSTLSSFIFFNKVEIVALVQEDGRFLSELFHQLGSGEDDISLPKRRDLVQFLKEFCTFSQTLQPASRDTFFKVLSTNGVLSALEITLTLDDQVIKSASVDILSYIVEYSPSMVREYMMQQQNKVEEEQYLLNIIIEQMVLDIDPQMGGAVQLMGILRLLIDPENMISSVTKSERADFLTFVYKHSMHALIAPLLANTVGDEVGKEDYQTAQLLALILELLAFCVEHHTYHIKNYIVQRDLLKRILVLMKSKHTFLVLGALRFMRKIIGLRDDFYNRHIISSNLFAPVVEAFVRNNGRYNLLDSAIIEMFEYIKVEKLLPLCANIVEKFGPVLSKVDYVQTFHALSVCYDQDLNKSSKDDKKMNPALDGLGGVVRGASGGLSVVGVPGGRYRRDIREMDPDEEIWFNTDDDLSDSTDTSHNQLPTSTRKATSTNSQLPDSAGCTDTDYPSIAEKDMQILNKGQPLEDTPEEEILASDDFEDEKVEKEDFDSKPLCPANKLPVTGLNCNSPPDTRETNENINFSTSNENAISHLPTKKVSLVDYEENSDDEETEEDENSQSDDSSTEEIEHKSKRPRLNAE